MCEAIDNSNSACGMIKTHIITHLRSRVTLVATVMTEGEIMIAKQIQKLLMK